MATTLVYDKLDGGIKYHYSNVKSIAEAIIIKSQGKYLFNNSFAVITSYAISTGDNVAITPTLGKALYTYVLGFQPYNLVISGILYNNPDSPYPVAKFMTDFTSARAYNNKEFVQVAIGNICFRAVMTNFQITGNMSDTHELQFTLTLQGIA